MGRWCNKASQRICCIRAVHLGSTTIVLAANFWKILRKNGMFSSAFYFNHVVEQMIPGATHSAASIQEINMAHVLSGVPRSISQCSIHSWKFIPKF